MEDDKIIEDWIEDLVITFNHKGGAETITLNDIETALAEEENGSDLVSFAYPLSMQLFSPFPLPVKGEKAMTNTQKQCLLRYLGYYQDAIDGIWGPLSETGLKAFQKDHGLAANGIFDAETREMLLKAISDPEGDWWEEIEYFTPSEFACKCGAYCDGYPAQMEESLVRVADRIRRAMKAPAVVSSGLRCARHNAAVGGVANSRHLAGKAMDFRIVGKTAGEVLTVVNQQPEIRYAYAINDSFVHMDVV